MDKKTIFLAEAENHVREAIRLLLEHQEAFTVIGEANHIEGLLAQVCQHPPEIILLDWNLSGMNPQRLIRTLREYCPKTKLVAMSVKPEQKKNACALGVNHFLSKQLPPDQFIGKLMQAVQANGPA